jgi:hypothetical protein
MVEFPQSKLNNFSRVDFGEIRLPALPIYLIRLSILVVQPDVFEDRNPMF